MDFTPNPDIQIPFTHSQYKPTTERLNFPQYEFQEQAFQTLRTDRFQDITDPNQRSQSADRTWGVSTFGKKDDAYFQNKVLPKSDWKNTVPIPYEETGGFKDNKQVKLDLQEIQGIVTTEAKFAEFDHYNKDPKKGPPKLKVITTKTPRKPFTVPKSDTRRTTDYKVESNYCRSPKKTEEKQAVGTPKISVDRRESQENDRRSPRVERKEVIHIERVSVEPVEHKEKETYKEIYKGSQYEDNSQRVEPNSRETSKKAIELDTLKIQNKLKDKRIEELEKQVAELLSSVDLYKARFTGCLDVVKKEFLEHDIFLIKLKEDLHALSEHTFKIISLSQIRSVDKGNVLFELGQDIEKNKTIWARVHSEIEKMTEHVRISEDRTRKLVELARVGNHYELIKDTSTGYKPGFIDSQYKIGESFEVQKLKEDLRTYMDALDMEEKTVKRLTGQVKDMEELISKYLKSENGQLNSGLKNTARKLIELQNKLEKSNLEREEFEGQSKKLKRENEMLQSEVYMLGREKEKWSYFEKNLRETQSEYKKLEGKNEVLTEINTKNEAIIETLKALVADLTTNKQVRDKSLIIEYDKKFDKFETSQLNSIPNVDSLSYKNPPIYTGADEFADRKFSTNSNTQHSKILLGQLNTTSDDPYLVNKSYSRDVSGESRLRYVDPPGLEKPSAYLNAHTREAESWPASAQYSVSAQYFPQEGNTLIPVEQKSNKLDYLNMDLGGLQETHPYKDSSY